MRIRRYTPQRRGMMFGFGCLAGLAACLIVLVVGLIILIPALPAISLRLMGFSAKGQTEAVFVAVTPVPTIQLENAASPSQATIVLGTYGSQTLPTNTFAYTIEVGTTNVGGQAAVATFTEAGLMELCRSLSDLCRVGDSRFRNVRLDLKPGGAIVYADVSLPDLGISQNVGIVLHLDNSNTQLQVLGVDVGGVLYQAPPNNLGEMVSDIERIGNEVLSQLILRAGGENYTLTSVYIDENRLTLVLR